MSNLILTNWFLRNQVRILTVLTGKVTWIVRWAEDVCTKFGFLFLYKENENTPWILVTCSNCSFGGDGRGSLPVDTAKIGKVCNIYGKNFTHFDGSWETYLFCYGLTATYYLMHNGLNVLKLPWFLCLRYSIIWIYWRKNKYFMSGSFHFSFFVFWSKWPKKKKKSAVIFRQNTDFLYIR